MLLLKLTLAPLLVAVATVAAQKWGPRVGGLLMGLPLTTGPIFLLLLFEQGPDFAAEATLGILFGLIGLTAFAVVYATVAAWTGWIGSIVSATIAFFAVSIGARSLGTHIAVAGIAAWCVPALALPLMRRPAFAMPHTNPPWWNLLVRMFAVAVLTLLATTMAMRLGAVFSGIVGTYPVAITVVIIFTHHQFGARTRYSDASWMCSVVDFLRKLLRCDWSFAGGHGKCPGDRPRRARRHSDFGSRAMDGTLVGEGSHPMRCAAIVFPIEAIPRFDSKLIH